MRPPRNATKARVVTAVRSGRSVVIKDFRARPLWVRALFGRPSVRREARAYARLDGVSGVPRCYGTEGPEALVLERLVARPVSADEPVPERRDAFFEDAARLLDAIHARGVAIADLHRSNLLVDRDGRPAIVDFAMARLARRDGRPGPLVRWAMRLDRHALARIEARARGLAEPRLDGGAGALYRAGRALKRALASLRGRERLRTVPGTTSSRRK